MVPALEERLQKFLDDHEEGRKVGITLVTVYRIAKDCADALLQLEQREIAWRDDFRKEFLSTTKRIRDLEADFVLLKERVSALESGDRRRAP